METYEDENNSVLLGDVPELDVNEFFESEEEENFGEEAEEAKEGGENRLEKNSKPVKPRKVVQNPQPKLNFEALQGPKGLIALNKQFEKFKFRGDRYEKEDLAETVKLLEQWAYRLYPKFHFEDSLQRLESLGKKKIVQTYLKKLRLGMGDADNVISQQDDDDEENNGTDRPNNSSFDESNGNIQQENQFDLLLSQEIERNARPKDIALTQDQIELIQLKRKQALERRSAKIRESNSQPHQPMDRSLDPREERDFHH